LTEELNMRCLTVMSQMKRGGLSVIGMTKHLSVEQRQKIATVWQSVAV